MGDELIWGKLKQLLYGLSRIYGRSVFIPDFRNVWIILRTTFVSIMICATYSLSRISNMDNFLDVFVGVIEVFAPYFVAQMLLLSVFAKIIKELKTLKALFLLFFLNFASIYLVSYATNGISVSVNFVWAKFFLSFSIVSLFLMYFDWREKNQDPSNTLAKLVFLQSKMNPHFLFNALNVSISLINKNPQKAKEMLLNLSSILRVSLRDDLVQMYSLKEEMSLCKKYLEIESIRFGDSLRVIIDIEGGDNSELLKCLVPRLSIQPLIENAVAHGVQNIEGGAEIRITIASSAQKDKFTIKIVNDLPPVKSQGTNSISLKNLKERLSIFYDGRAEISATEVGQTFQSVLVIPKVTSDFGLK